MEHSGKSVSTTFSSRSLLMRLLSTARTPDFMFVDIEAFVCTHQCAQKRVQLDIDIY